ncbi:MAG: hypothetical protein HN348_20120 [Proteobacteria bacterium]|jgi:hypothetical protein|nr:hypothetical protein [Pseudomonadota bacterium]
MTVLRKKMEADLDVVATAYRCCLSSGYFCFSFQHCTTIVADLAGWGSGHESHSDFWSALVET